MIKHHDLDVTIELDKHDFVYNSGDLVTGRLVLRLDEALKLNTIYMTFLGDAKVSIIQVFDKKSIKKTLNSYEEYFNMKKYLCDNSGGGDCVVLDTGEHVFSFQFQLPKCVPTSFEHTFAYIRYTLTATIDIPWAFDYHITKRVSIVNILDLNLKPELAAPMTVDEQKVPGQYCYSFFWCCFKEKPINIKINVNKRGFVTGEAVKFSVCIENNSSKHVKHLFASVVQKLKLYAKGKTTVFHRQLTEIVYSKGIMPLETQEWNNVCLSIPATVPTSSFTSQVIDISYYFVVSLTLPGMEPDFDVLIPIEIGTVPIVGEEQLQRVHSSCTFGPPGRNANLETIDSGETRHLDSEFVPCYPYFVQN